MAFYKLGGETFVSRAEYPLQPKAGGRIKKGLALYLPNMKLTSLWRTTIASEQSLGLQCAASYRVLKFPYKFSLILGVLLQNQINC